MAQLKEIGESIYYAGAVYKVTEYDPYSKRYFLTPEEDGHLEVWADEEELRPKTRATGAGFSLIELLVVVAIMLVLVSIAAPNFLRAKESSNEVAACSTLRTINSSEQSFSQDPANGGNYATLTSLSTNGYLDKTVADGMTRNGYTFTATLPAAGQYLAYSSPVTLNSTGTKYYCVIDDGALRYSTSAITTRSGCIAGTAVGSN